MPGPFDDASTAPVIPGNTVMPLDYRYRATGGIPQPAGAMQQPMNPQQAQMARALMGGLGQAPLSQLNQMAGQSGNPIPTPQQQQLMRGLMSSPPGQMQGSGPYAPGVSGLTPQQIQQFRSMQNPNDWANNWRSGQWSGAGANDPAAQARIMNDLVDRRGPGRPNWPNPEPLQPIPNWDPRNPVIMQPLGGR